MKPDGSGYWYSSYGYNFWGGSLAETPRSSMYNDGLCAYGTNANRKLSVQVRDDEVKVPSDMIAIGDGFVGLSGLRTLESVHIGRYSHMLNIPPFRPSDAGFKRHNQRLNVVFCDGHVEGTAVKHLLFDWSDRWVIKFNRDHLPHRSEQIRY